MTSVSLSKLVLIYSIVMLQQSKYDLENSCKETCELTSKALQVLQTYKNLIIQLVYPHIQKSHIHMAKDDNSKELR